MSASPQPVAPTAPARGRRAGTRCAEGELRLVLLLAIVAGIAVTCWLVLRRPGPEPPEVELSGVDPAIAAAVREARADVIAQPHSAAAWGRLGQVYRAHDFVEAANTCFARAEALDPNEPRWPYLQGATIAMTDRESALPYLERAATTAAVDVPRLRLAEVLLQLGRVEEAESHFREVLGRAPNNPRARLGLARIASSRDQLPKAQEHLAVVLATPLGRKAGLILRAEIHQRSGNPEAAAEDLRRAAQAPDDPPWPDPFVEEVERLAVGVQSQLALANQLLNQGRAPEAFALLEQLSDTAKESERVLTFLGQARLRTNDPRGAESALRKALASNAGSVEANFHFGSALYAQQRYAAAAEAFEKTVALKPSHAFAHYNLGHCRLQQKDRAGAIAAFAEAVRYRPDYADAHINLGDLLAQAGKDTEALRHLEEAVRLQPSDARAQRLLREVKARLSTEP